MKLKEQARARIHAAAAALLDVSHGIHADPELAFAEVRAAATLTQELEDAGFAVERGVADLPTAFRATYGNGPLTIAFCAEYDALPGIGHACGHNLIAASSLGAALGLAAVADATDVTVIVLGTPAEEAGGGKVLMLERGAFDGVHAAMMVHPSAREQALRVSLAIAELNVRFTGKAAHASAAPEAGLNAADALTVAQVALGLLRQHLRPTDRVHGITTAAGEAPNIVPGAATAEYYIRARTLPELAGLERRVRACFEAGALATGCEVEFSAEGPPYANLNPDVPMTALYRANAEALGRVFDEDGLDPVGVGSTDMGDVTEVMPAIHPFVAVEAGGARPHEVAFAAACTGPSADRALLDAATAMAWTAIDLATDSGQRGRLLRGEREALVHSSAGGRRG